MNSAIATNGGGSIDDEAGNIGVGFAIPVEQVVITADQILENGEAQYPVIGARVQTGGPAEFDGATVDEVLADSPAQDAGLENGDLITHVNGARITDGIGLIVAIRTHQPGETIEFTVRRDGVKRRSRSPSTARSASYSDSLVDEVATTAGRGGRDHRWSRRSLCDRHETPLGASRGPLWAGVAVAEERRVVAVGRRVRAEAGG